MLLLGPPCDPSPPEGPGPGFGPGRKCLALRASSGGLFPPVPSSFHGARPP